ncbi:glycosyltransferase [Paenibacillus sp. 1001270B_150601_E10]|uniref:glycosyltransferase n=1 Tax=Paenibacillus sp. 1001270B_150601_E10 TaxID=2787079 RepID=UPI0018A0B6D6|nr:glycosyltransferase [Paenibacillus sp. 1001270B_150601_E10]
MNTLPARILQVIPSTGYGGISSMLMNLYRALPTEQVQFDFAAFNRGPLHNEIEARGGRVFYFEYMKKQGLLRYMKALKRLIHDHGPYQAIHVHNGYKGGFALLAARMAGIPTRVCHIHTSNVEEKWQRSIMPLLRAVSVANATKRLACGEEAGRFMYGQRDFEVLTNAIQTSAYQAGTLQDRYRIRKEWGIPKDCFVIGHIGRLSAVKNHAFMLDIAEELRRRIDGAAYRMVCIGEGPLREELEREIRERKLQSHILLVGTRADIPSCLNAVDMYLFPSLFEGLPVSLLEAQAAALPCLVSSGVPRESDIEAGLVRFMDLKEGPAAWSEAIVERSRMGLGDTLLAGKKLEERGYDVAQNVKRLTHIYNLGT